MVYPFGMDMEYYNKIHYIKTKSLVAEPQVTFYFYEFFSFTA